MLKVLDKAVYDEFAKMIKSSDGKDLRTLRLLRNADLRVFHTRLIQAEANLIKALKQIRKDLKIYARKAFSCCGSCGSYELSHECEKSGKEGYMFYSRQAKHSLEESGRLYFNYGAVNDDDDYSATKKLGEKIVSILMENNGNVEWDGSPATSILIKV